jgi:hypothetical protein
MKPADDMHPPMAQRVERIYRQAVQIIDENWDGLAPRLGRDLHRALVAEELMRLIAAQDEAIPADVLRRLLDGTWEALNTDPAFQA